MSEHDEEREPAKSPRRAFFTSAFVSLTSLMAGAIEGCGPDRSARKEADDAELNSLRAVDAHFVTYRETSTLDTGMEAPRGVAVDRRGGFVVAGDRALARFDKTGRHLGTLPVEGDPTAIALAPDGSMYVGLTDHVEVFGPDGAARARWGSYGGSAHITSVAVGRAGVLVADAAGRTVYRCDRDGRVAARIGGKDAAAGYPGLVIPSLHLGAAFGLKGTVFVSNPGMHRMEKHSIDGDFLSSWGAPANTLDGFCGCCNPTDFACLPDGRFVTAEKGIPRVKIYAADGRFQEVVAAPDSFGSSVMGLDLASTPDGRVAVLDPQRKTVRLFTRADERKTS